jgi:acylphosphatase
MSKGKVAMQRSTCHFSGNVQGVGFRYTALKIAQGFEVTGYVRNLPDGGVELVTEGEAREREGVLEEINEQMGEYIRHVDVKTSPATGEFHDFSVRH